MLERTRKLWTKQHALVGDRTGMFSAVAQATSAATVLYPGSYVDVTPSFVWPTLTYVDIDKRAKQFFGDEEGVEELLTEHGVDRGSRSVRFIHQDYTEALDLPEASFDLLVSLYAGLVSEHCTQHLKVGGHLFAAPSHGDVAMASLDPRYRLTAVVTSVDGRYATSTTDLDTYLIPKRDIEVTAELVRETGRGVAYTKSPFGYIFERVA